MKHKRIVSMLLAAFMTLSMPLSGYAEKTVEHGASTEVTPYVADTQAPVLNDISISATEVQAGECLTVTIDATDDISGVKCFSAVFINEANNREYRATSITPDSLQINISEYEEEGTFYLDTLWIDDNAGNYSEYRKNAVNLGNPLPKEVSFTVQKNEKLDKEPPELESISLDHNTVKAGDTLKISLNAKDNLSGIKSFSVVFINEENEREYRKTSTSPDSLEINISEYEEGGTFYLDTLWIDDYAGNYSVYRKNSGPLDKPLPQDISFVILENEKADLEPPVFSSISIDKKEIKAGESVTLTLNAQDSKSGIAKFSVWFINRENGREIFGESTTENPLILHLNTSIYEPTGIYELKTLWIDDNAGNYDDYVGELSEKISFYLVNEDTTSPSTPEDKPSNNSGESNTPSSENSNENSSNVSSGLSLSINRNEVKQESPKQQSKSIQIKDSKTNITISAPKGVLPEGTTAKVSPISNVASALSDKLGTFLLYDIKLVDENGNTVQPKGTVTVGIPVPDGFDIDKLVVYYIDEEGNLIEYPVVVKDGVAYFETDHFSYYALAEKQGNSLTTQSTTETQTDSNKPNPSTGAQDLTAVLAAAAVSLMGLVVLGKKKH